MRIGIIGAGYWGSKHVRVFHELPESQVAMVADLDLARLEAVRHLYPGVRTTTDYCRVLESDLDAVVVATPVTTHYAVARGALLADKDVLVEKPLTDSTETARELVQLAEERGRVLMVGHTYLYHPAMEFLRDFLESGELGDLYYVDSARLNLGMFRPDVDVLWDLASHDLSMLLSLLGEDPNWVKAEGMAHINPSMIEVSYLDLGFPQQVLAHVHVSWLDPCKVRRLTLVGSKRMVVFDDVAPMDQVHIYDKGVTLDRDGNGNNGASVQYRYGEVRIPCIPDGEPLRAECAHFLDCVASSAQSRSDGRQGLQIVSILEAAHRSLANGGHRQPLSEPILPGSVPAATRTSKGGSVVEVAL